MNRPLAQAVPPPGLSFGDIQLELSLKPFWDASDATRDAVLAEMFTQWHPLTRFSRGVSVMLLVGDGSEILEYDGEMGSRLEWARYHGCVNPIGHAPPPEKPIFDGNPDHDSIGLNAARKDPEARGVHVRSYLYRDQPAEFDYRWLRELVSAIRRAGSRSGSPVSVGTIFDIGPEFAVSRFKYAWHPEICGGGALFGGKFVRCDANLRGDTRRYAAFPDGVPDGTPFGMFLGKQCKRYFSDIGFDYLWLSNGFGFALEPWALTGAVFNGLEFDASAATGVAGGIMEFWKHFRSGFPRVPLRTRGTNLTTGIDLASDASPIREIFRTVEAIEPPVNSPWAALDGDIGLELAGWMSHIAELPGNDFRFRYYIHDCWWLNSPWLDRYQRQPHDIYLPLSVSRLSREGTVQIPANLAFLSVDDSHGCLPPNVPLEVCANFSRAREFAPDAPGPLVWVYPFDDYHDLVCGPAARPDLPFFGDWFVRNLINATLPINTVVNVAELAGYRASKPLDGVVLIGPALPTASTRLLVDHARDGGTTLLYGPLTECPELQDILGVAMGDPLEGDFVPSWSPHHRLRHTGFLSAGGWSEMSGQSEWSARQGGAERCAAAGVTFASGGRLLWVRGSLATSEFNPDCPAPIKGPRLSPLGDRSFLGTEEIARSLLASAGWVIRGGEGVAPHLTIHRNRNAFVFSSYRPPGAGGIAIGTPVGAPIPAARTVDLRDGLALFDDPSAAHHVCRAFVRQSHGRVTGRILPPIQHGYHERFLVTGLDHAIVHFFPDPAYSKFEVLSDPNFPFFHGTFHPAEIVGGWGGPQIIVENVTGELLFSW